MNFIKQWYKAMASREEARAKNVANLRQQHMDFELRREHTHLIDMMVGRVQWLLPVLAQVYASDLQTEKRTLNDLVKMAFATVEFMKLEAQKIGVNGEIFEATIGSGWARANEPIEVLPGTLVKMHKG